MCPQGGAACCGHPSNIQPFVTAVLLLCTCREVLKPQPELLYEDKDGTAVFKDCIVGRWKEYNWCGCNNKVFR
jgi:hypothetical protein